MAYPTHSDPNLSHLCEKVTKKTYFDQIKSCHNPNFNNLIFIYATTRMNTLLMADILSSLCDGGELSFMNGDNNPDGINLETYRVTS